MIPPTFRLYTRQVVRLHGRNAAAAGCCGPHDANLRFRLAEDRVQELLTGEQLSDSVEHRGDRDFTFPCTEKHFPHRTHSHRQRPKIDYSAPGSSTTRNTSSTEVTTRLQQYGFQMSDPESLPDRYDTDGLILISINISLTPPRLEHEEAVPLDHILRAAGHFSHGHRRNCPMTAKTRPWPALAVPPARTVSRDLTLVSTKFDGKPANAAREGCDHG